MVAQNRCVGSRFLAVAAAVAALVLAGHPPAVEARQGPYAALGDSFTAGPLVPNQVPDPPGCLRSDRNYPRLAARALGVPLRDVSCSGATTEDMTRPQPVVGGPNRPQLDALTPATGLVTVSVSGNDIGFSEIVATCASVTPLGRPCQDRYVGPGGDEISRRIVAAAPKVAAVLAEARRRAPLARLYVVGYPAILPEHGPGCWPVMPIAFADVPYLRDKEKELNAMLAAQAAAAGARYVDTYGPSIGHDACASPLRRWVEPAVPTSPAAPVHPNARGMRGIATVVVTAIRQSGASTP